MSEHEGNVRPDSQKDGGTDPEEARLRALCDSAYLSLTPSDALRQRVAELAAQHPLSTARQPRWSFGRPGWGLAAAAAAAALFLALAGLVFVRQQPARRQKPGAGVTLAGGKKPEGHRVPAEVRRPSAGHSTAPLRSYPRTGAEARPDMRIASALRQASEGRGERKRSATRTLPAYPSPHDRMPVLDDLASVNRDAATTLREWAAVPPDEWDRIEARVRGAVRVRDDFVQIPFPRIASASERQIAEAVESYKQEAAIVDPRLSREITLAVKAMAFADLCERLRADTGIEITAGPSVADDKVTLFCERRPLREIMRAINHVFGFTWLRTRQAFRRSGVRAFGKDTADWNARPEGTRPERLNADYRYELAQDLRSQLAEEELRNRDGHAALAALDEEMAAYRPVLDLSREELEHRLTAADGPEKQRLATLESGATWAAAQLYQRLTAAQRLSLAAGETIEFTSDAGSPDQRLPAAWREKLMSSSPLGAAPPDDPAAMPSLALHIDRSELGQLSLKYRLTVPSGGGSLSFEPGEPLAVGQSPSVARPDNAGTNQALRAEPLFQRQVSFQPRPSCPRLAAGARRPDAEAGPEASSPAELGPETPHVSTADVWEAVHEKSGLDLIADSYSRVYPVDRVTVARLPLFDGLNRVTAALGARWKKEGDFLLCRSTRYFWDRLKEVPNRYLTQWQRDSRAQGGLPLDDFLQMAALSDAQLDSAVVGQVVEHCWGLEEWGIIGSGPPRGGNVAVFNLRPFARFVAMLTPEQRRQSQTAGWLAAEALTPAQQEALARALQPQGIPPQYLTGMRLHYDYLPAGGYVCGPWTNSPRREELLKAPVVVARTREAALAAARRLLPDLQLGDIQPCHGIFSLACHLANGRSWDIGWPLAMP